METRGPEHPPIQSYASADEELQDALDRLSRHAFEHGLYDRNEMPEGGSDA